jgi:hypothetical protein
LHINNQPQSPIDYDWPPNWMTGYDCDFNRSMQHPDSYYREEDVENMAVATLCFLHTKLLLLHDEIISRSNSPGK